MNAKVHRHLVYISPWALLFTIATLLLACEASTAIASTASQQHALPAQQKWDALLRDYRCLHAPSIERRHNETYLAGQHPPTLTIEGCTHQPNQHITVSQTTLYMSARAAQLRDANLTPHELARRLTTDILRIEAYGVRDLEYVECFTGIMCIFTGPLQGLNEIDHVAKLLQGQMEAVTGAQDTDPEMPPRPPSVLVP